MGCQLKGCLTETLGDAYSEEVSLRHYGMPITRGYCQRTQFPSIYLLHPISQHQDIQRSRKACKDRSKKYTGKRQKRHQGDSKKRDVNEKNDS